MVNLGFAKDASVNKVHKGLGLRHLQAALAFGGISVGYILRVNLSVAIVIMAASTKYKVDLENKEKALVLSSLLWGYGFLQIPFGAWGRRGYAAKLFALSSFLPGIFTLITPYAALDFGFVGICVLRFLVGLLQGSIYPNVNTLMANWLVPSERDAVMCLVQSGCLFGSLVSTSLSGYLGYYYDWPSIFYVSGLIAVVWGIIVFTFGSEGAHSCKRLSDKERTYIQESMKVENKEACKEIADVPWKEIFTSIPFIALAITCWCSAWSEWTMFTLIPTYIDGALGFSLDDNGLVGGMSYLCSWVTIFLFSFISWIITNRTKIPVSFMRPFWNSLGMYGVGGTLLVMAFAPVNVTMAVALLALATSISGATSLGYLVNCLDISPNFAGVVFSIMNTIGNISAILGPLVSTYLIEDSTNLYQWRLVFSISGGLSIFGNSLFIIWGSTKKQPWDEGKKRMSDKVQT